MCKGELRRELTLTIPDDNFLNQIKSICFPAKTGLFLWFGPSDNFKQTAYGEAIIATIINASYEIIDLRAELPQQSIIQVQKADGGYQLFTGIFETSEEDGTIKIYQIYYLVNRTDGVVTRKRYDRFPAVASAGDYIKKTDRLILGGYSPADLKSNS